MVADALAQQGIRAVVMEKDEGLSITTKDAAPIWIDASADLQQWSMLPINIRQRKANLLAMRFVHIRSGGGEKGSAEPSQFQLPEWLEPLIARIREVSIPPWAKLLTLLGLAIGTLATIFVLTRKDPPPPPPPDPASETLAARTARLGRACDATRAMMWRGGAWTSMPLEGWTVELWLSRKDGEPISVHPSLETLVKSGKVHWGEKSAFAEITDGKASIVAGNVPAPRSDVTIIFEDGYARPFFDIERRHEFIAIGEQMVQDTKADWGALYARCAHLTVRDVGSWFYGRDAAKAATALMYTMGKPASSKSTDFMPIAKDFVTISTSASKLEEAAFFGLVYQDSARTSTKGGIFVSFPFGNPVNAPQASKRVAGEIGL